MNEPDGNSVLLLRPQDVTDVVAMADAIDLVEQGYREAAASPLMNAPRRRVHSRANVRVSNFPGGVDGLGVIGAMTRADWVNHDPDNQVYAYREHPVYLLWSSENGRLLAIMLGEITEKSVGYSSIAALRTAATSGVGFRHLARKDARVAGIYGTSGQALHMMLALACERDIELFKVYGRNEENRRRFCADMAERLDAEVVPVETPREVMDGADVVVTATNSNVPVFDGEWIEPGQHIATIVGSNIELVKGGWLKSGRRENDDLTVQRADFIITNWLDSVRQDQQAGLMEPIERGLITWDKVHELGALLTGDFAGRTSDEQISYHANNNGTAAADLAVAKLAYDECVRLGRGMPIELPLPGRQ
jgi:ornithine cyclodeaminase